MPRRPKMILKNKQSETTGFELVSCIGSGGMGSVYKALDSKTAQTVAVKFLDTPPSGDHDERERRFQREIEILKHLQHPHIVRVLSTGKNENVPYFVMEFVSGGTLRERMKSVLGRLDEAIRVVRQIASALDYLHANGVVHRDLKPENVLILEDGSVKLTDFGISSIEQTGSTQLTTTGQVLGTFEYMSPEQRHRLPVDHRSDIYSLGVLTYELLTGRQPAGRFRAASEWNINVPSEVDPVLNQALAEEPDDRFDSAHEFVSRLVRAFRLKSIVKRARIVGLGSLVLAMCAALPVLSEWMLSKSAPERAAAPTNQVQHVASASETTPAPKSPEFSEPIAPEPVPVVPPPNENQTVEFYIAKAKLAAKAHDWTSAIESCTQALRIDDKNIEALIYRAHMYFSAGAKPESIADLDQVFSLDRNNEDAPALMGKILHELGDNQGAIQHLTTAIKSHPKDPVLRTYLGECLYNDKQYIPALIQLNTAIKFNDPEMPGEAYYYRALVRVKAADWKKALEDLETWVEKHPTNPLAVTALGKIMIDAPESSEIRDLTRGLGLCRVAYEMRSTEGIVLRNYASALLANDELGQAKQIAELALENSSAQKKVASRQLLDRINDAIAAKAESKSEDD